MTQLASVEFIGALGYAAAALLMALLGVLLLTTWRGRLQGGLFLLAVLVSGLWAGLLAWQLWQGGVPVRLLWLLEGLRALCWLLFLLRMLGQLPGDLARRLRPLRLGAILGMLALLLPLEDWWARLATVAGVPFVDLRLLIQVLLAVAGLFLIEQLFRATPWQHRWGIKYLCLGLGGLFAFDLYLYSEALLLGRIDAGLWFARGLVMTLVVPLLAVSVARNPQWSFDLSVSRAVVVHSSALAATGLYLFGMALAGYWIRDFGGEWSAVFQPLFLFGAGLLLMVLLSSGNLRSRLRLFVIRHFYSYRYDYREEWLRLIEVLSGTGLQASLPERVIHALGELVDSPGGCLWVMGGDGVCRFRRCWNLPEASVERDWTSAPLAEALSREAIVIDLEGALGAPSGPSRLLPEWMLSHPRLWLLVPLPHDRRLQGFVLLAKPRAPQPLGWENLELLHTAARQAASYLAFDEAARALAEAQQFEGFNRLSAFVVHDLKNLVAQLSLVARNAERHRDNPAFVDDALETVAHAVERMNRLLSQLRAAVPTVRREPVVAAALVAQVVAEHRNREPRPVLIGPDDSAIDDGAVVEGDRDRLAAVLGNIITNAQDATDRNGQVSVRMATAADWICVEVADTGCGMDETFIRERLFRPFDSTKGLAGMGIGAYECREFVTLLGGRVEVESALGQGTRFRLWLPRADRPASNPALPVLAASGR